MAYELVESGPRYELVDEKGYGPADLLAGHESAARAATSMFSVPLSGFAGMLGSVLSGPQGQGAKWAQAVQNALTYEPRTKLGQQVSELAALPGLAISKPAEFVGEKVADAGFPALGAYLNGGIQAAPTALMFGKPSPVVRTSPAQQTLLREGVSMTPGQIVGGAAKRMEDAATSIPIMGDTIKAAQRRGVESFNQAAINRSLAPIGEKLPAGAVGNKAIDFAYGKLGDAYDSLLPNLKGSLDGTLQSDVTAIRNKASMLPKQQRAELNSIIQNEITDKLKSGPVTGEIVGNIKEELGKLSKDFGKSEHYYIRNLGQLVGDLNAAVKDMVNRVNPNYAGELARIDQGYANFKIAQNAAASLGANEGVFTPAQLQRAVRKFDFSKDKARFAEGNARMQDLSAAGKSVLPQSVPDSGTPLRAAMMYAAANPVKAMGLGIPIGLGSLAYTSPMQSLMQGALTAPISPLGPGLLSMILQEQALQAR